MGRARFGEAPADRPPHLWLARADWIDPLTSLAIAAVIFVGTWGLLRESFSLSMQAAPKGVDPAAVRAFLLERPGVADVHDLHIRAMSTTAAALTAHLFKRFADGATGELHDRFGIEHATVQIERRHAPRRCRQAADSV